MVNSDLAGRFF